MIQSQNKSEIALLAELVISQGLKAESAQKAQAEAQKAQAEAQKAQAEAQKAQAVQIQKLEETLVSKLVFVTNELAIIKSNTVTIMGRQIQDFHGVFPETKEALEAAGEEIAADESILELVEAFETDGFIPHYKTGKLTSAKTNRGVANTAAFYGKKSVTTVKQSIKNLGLENYPGLTHLIPLGNYVSSIVTKLNNVNFGGLYPPSCANLIDQLVTYHVSERTSPRKY